MRTKQRKGAGLAIGAGVVLLLCHDVMLLLFKSCDTCLTGVADSLCYTYDDLSVYADLTEQRLSHSTLLFSCGKLFRFI